MTTIPYLSSRTGLSLRFAASARCTLSARADYAFSGGADAPARAVVPFQRGPVGAFEAEWALTRRDRVIATLAATQATFSPGPDDAVGEAQVAWRRRLDRRTESTLAAGAALVLRRDALSAGASAYPVAEAAIDHRLAPERLDARFSVRLAPIVSWLNGLVDERVQGDVMLAWTPRGPATLRVQVGVAQSVPVAEDAALTLVLGEAAVAIQATRSARFELGTRGAWQKQRGLDASPPQWVVFAGATFAAPTLRF